MLSFFFYYERCLVAFENLTENKHSPTSGLPKYIKKKEYIYIYTRNRDFQLCTERDPNAAWLPDLSFKAKYWRALSDLMHDKELMSLTCPYVVLALLH